MCAVLISLLAGLTSTLRTRASFLVTTAPTPGISTTCSRNDSLVAERDHGIDAERAPGCQIAGGQRDREQQRGDRGKRRRIDGIGAVHEVLEHPRDGGRPGQTERQ